MKDKVLYWYLGLGCAELFTDAGGEKKAHSGWVEIAINFKHYFLEF